MFGTIRRYLKGLKLLGDAAHFLNVASQYEKEADTHRIQMRYHEAAETHCRNMAKAAREAARRL